MSVCACVCMFITCKVLKKLTCTCTVAYKFGVHTIASEHMWHMSDAGHKLTIGLQHYKCGVQVRTYIRHV